MCYVISDIHGCYREYTTLLKKINFTNRDYLYVLGDAVDRIKGLKYILPMGILQLIADAYMEAGVRLTVLRPDYRNM